VTPPRRAPLLYDTALEEGVLGAMLHWAEVRTKALEDLSPGDFGDPATGALFRLIGELGDAADPTLLWHRAHAAGIGARESIGAYVHTLYSGATTKTAGLQTVAELVTLRKRRSLEDVSELARRAAVSEDPAQAAEFIRVLVTQEPSKNGHHRISAAELLAMDFPEPNWIVPGMLPEGLAMFGGRPKARKSFLVLQMCMARATGGVFLGQRLERAPVVYFALEDGPRRLAKRLRDLSCPRSVEGLDLQVTLPRLDKGGLEHLEAAREQTGADLFVIDTLEKAMVGCERKRDTDVNAHLTAILSPYHDWALSENVALMFVDHLRKPGMTKRSLINDVMGGTAKVGVADTIWGLWREAGETKGEFQMTGRDVEESAHLLEWKPTPLGWQYVGDLEDAQLSDSERRYVEAVSRIGPEVDSQSIANYLGVTPQAAQDMLRKLREKGTLELKVEPRQKGGRAFLYSLGAGTSVKADKRPPVERAFGPLGFDASGESPFWDEE
jgi:hypothetical protein